MIGGVAVVRRGTGLAETLTAGLATADVGREAILGGILAVCVELGATEPWVKGAGRTPPVVSSDE